MQFYKQVFMLPWNGMVGFAPQGVTKILHDSADLRILLHTDQYICVTHGTHGRVGVQLFQNAAFHRQIIDAVFLKGSIQFFQSCHLGMIPEDQLAVLLEKPAHYRIGLGDTAQHRALVCQAVYLMAVDQLLGIFQTESCRQRNRLTGNGAADQI